MYNLIEYTSNYSESMVLFYRWSNCNANIANNTNFKSFEYKVKLLGKTEADGVNVILEDARKT